MTAYFELADYIQTFFGVGAIVLLLGAAYILAAALTMRLSRGYMAYTGILAAVVIIILQGICDLSLQIGSSPQNFSFLAKMLKDVPWILVMALMLIVFVSEAACLAAIIRAGRDKLSPGAVKESLDALPDGVCFFVEGGRLLLANRRMQNISSDIMGTGILNGESLWKCIEEKATTTDVSDGLVLFTSDSKVWNVRRSETEAEGNKVYELDALDVTEQYRLKQELEERNRRLNLVNERLKIFSREMATLTAEKELLDAKIKVHDDVGRALLGFRAYLASEPDKRDREKLLPLWRHVVSVMKKEASPSDQWDAIEKSAEILNIDIRLTGRLPENGKIREAVLAAVRECLTNTARHAGGDTLFVHIETELKTEYGADSAEGVPARISACLTNNGRSPLSTIQEGGGLTNLRHIVERAGGTMTVKSFPQFQLRLDFESRVWYNN